MPYYYSKVFIQNCFPVDVVDSPYLIAVLTDSVVFFIKVAWEDLDIEEDEEKIFFILWSNFLLCFVCVCVCLINTWLCDWHLRKFYLYNQAHALRKTEGSPVL